MILVTAHSKGGVGKSTLTINLAQMLGSDILDLDLQHSCIFWNRSRQLAGMDALKILTAKDAAEVKNILNEYAANERLLLVDCGGFDSELNRIALSRANFILTPVSPSQVELYGLQNFTKILRQASELLGRKVVGNVVINNADARSKSAIEGVKDFVNTVDCLHLLDSTIHTRSDFKTAFAGGVSVEELNSKSKASLEISALIEEIKTLLK